MSFEKQVCLSHSAGVYVSMHEAGPAHIFHSALGATNCCALMYCSLKKDWDIKIRMDTVTSPVGTACTTTATMHLQDTQHTQARQLVWRT